MRPTKKSIPASHLTLRVGESDEARELVMRYHYSRRWPANVQYVFSLHEDGGLFGGAGQAVAACTFSIPPTRWSESVLELSRLVRRDETRPPLTRLISLARKWISRDKKENLLVSFADRTQGHEGIVYRAASWNYAGCRERAMDGVVIDGVFVPGRSCNSRWNTRSPLRLSELMPQSTIVPHYNEGMHCYWVALNRAGHEKAMRLGLKKIV